MVDKLKSIFKSKKKNLPQINEELLTEVLEERVKEDANQTKIKHYIIKHTDKQNLAGKI